MDIPARKGGGAPRRLGELCDPNVAGTCSICSSLSSTPVQSNFTNLASLIPDVIKRISHEPHEMPQHGHLSDSLAVATIVVIDQGQDLAPYVKKIIDADSERETALADLERKFVRSLAKRGPEAALNGWRLRESDYEGKCCEREYTPYHLRSVLQLMGLKQLGAHEVTHWTFSFLAEICGRLAQQWRARADGANKRDDRDAKSAAEEGGANADEGAVAGGGGAVEEGIGVGAAARVASVVSVGSSSQGGLQHFDVHLTRRQFLTLVRYALIANERCRRKHVKDFVMACQIREHHRGITILFGGTSGCGKSTLASLTASRLGIPTVLSTDFIRHMLRKTYSQEEKPILYASTYNAGLCVGAERAEGLSESELVLLGYKEQSQMIFERLDRVITAYEMRREPLIVEGVHLTMENTMELMKRHSTCIPFLVYISNEAKHKERFAVRAKYMALDSRTNRYVKFFDNIRIIQNNLVQGADRHLVPKIDNTNVDRSLAMIHATVIKCLRKQFKGASLLDVEKNQVTFMHKAYKQYEHDAWSSKAMLKTIRSKISKGEVLKRYFDAVSASKEGEGRDSGEIERERTSPERQSSTGGESLRGAGGDSEGEVHSPVGRSASDFVGSAKSIDKGADDGVADASSSPAKRGAGDHGEPQVGCAVKDEGAHRKSRVEQGAADVPGIGPKGGAGVRAQEAIGPSASMRGAEGQGGGFAPAVTGGLDDDDVDDDGDDDEEGEVDDEGPAGGDESGAEERGAGASPGSKRASGEGSDGKAGILRDAGSSSSPSRGRAHVGESSAAGRKQSIRGQSAKRASSNSGVDGGELHVQFDIGEEAAAGGGRSNSSPDVDPKKGGWKEGRLGRRLRRAGLIGGEGKGPERDEGKKGRGKGKSGSWRGLGMRVGANLVQLATMGSWAAAVNDEERRSRSTSRDPTGVGRAGSEGGASGEGAADADGAEQDGLGAGGAWAGKKREEGGEGGVGDSHAEEEEDTQMSVTSDGETGSSEDARPGGTESESESEGPGTLSQWDIDGDSCSWTPSVDVQAEEANEHDPPESSAAVTRGSHTHASSKGSWCGHSSKGSRSENGDADDEETPKPRTPRRGTSSPTSRRKKMPLAAKPLEEAAQDQEGAAPASLAGAGEGLNQGSQ